MYVCMYIEQDTLKNGIVKQPLYFCYQTNIYIYIYEWNESDRFI